MIFCSLISSWKENKSLRRFPLFYFCLYKFNIYRWKYREWSLNSPQNFFFLFILSYYYYERIVYPWITSSWLKVGQFYSPIRLKRETVEVYRKGCGKHRIFHEPRKFRTRNPPLSVCVNKTSNERSVETIVFLLLPAFFFHPLSPPPFERVCTIDTLFPVRSKPAFFPVPLHA